MPHGRTFVLLNFLYQVAAFLGDFGLADPLAHPKIPECGQGETSHLSPGVAVAEYYAWK